MKRWMAVVLVWVGCAAPSGPPPDVTLSVREMLTTSAAAWNRGDLHAFVSDYVADSTTSFVSGGTVHYGFDWIQDNYASSFEPGAQRDSLRFEGVAARLLGNEHALTTARYILFRGDSVTSSGLFTLALEYVNGGWKIIHDHTQRDPD